jgi:hypothetical protein
MAHCKKLRIIQQLTAAELKLDRECFRVRDLATAAILSLCSKSGKAYSKLTVQMDAELTLQIEHSRRPCVSLTALNWSRQRSAHA